MRTFRGHRPLIVIAAALAAVAVVSGAQEPAFDLLIKNGRVVDGTGSPWYRADVALRGDRIARIAYRLDAPAVRTIDARGQVIAPGFIDIHSHARTTIFEVPTAENYLRQGVTSIIEGPDGSSPIPIKPFLDKVAAAHVTVNFGTFIGQGSVRETVIGLMNRQATPDEIDKMRALVRQGMADGAFGLSTGLFYVPGTFTPTAEVIELAKVAGSLGGIHISHMREETAQVVDSVRETIEIGERGGLPTQVTHHKIIGKAYWGKTVDTLRLIDEARARGVDVTIDQYPYTASATAIASALLPSWALEGGREATLKRIQDARSRAEILADTVALLRDARGGGDPQNVQLSRCVWDPSLDGKRLGDVTKGRGLEPTLPNAAETVLWIVEQGGCGGIYHAIDEQDLQRVLRHPATMIASDGGIPVFGQGSPHPRNYGTFSRVLGRYVRDLKVITLEEAVRKMTSFPAQRLGLADRGVLREGLKADVAVFNPDAIRDRATFEQPHQYSEGVSLVVVNGQVVLDEGGVTAARPGRILYGPARAVQQNVPVVFETEKGPIEMEVDGVHAPATAANFLKYVDAGFYDGGSVNRAVRPDNTVRHDVEIQVIQFQIDPARRRDEFPPIPIERTTVTGLRHVDGALSMARNGPDTATASFSIVIGDQPEMDFGGRRNADGQGFAVFGRVTRGMDVVKAIQASPTGSKGPYGTESLMPPIRILKAYRKGR